MWNATGCTWEHICRAQRASVSLISTMNQYCSPSPVYGLAAVNFDPKYDNFIRTKPLGGRVRLFIFQTPRSSCWPLKCSCREAHRPPPSSQTWSTRRQVDQSPAESLGNLQKRINSMLRGPSEEQWRLCERGAVQQEVKEPLSVVWCTGKGHRRRKCRQGAAVVYTSCLLCT